MMASIFTPLDLTLSTNLSLNYSFMYFIALPLLFSQRMWTLSSSTPTLWAVTLSISHTLNKSVKSINSPLSIEIIHASFFNILLLNIMGLTPFLPSLTAHLAVTLSMGLTLWMTLVLHSMMHKPKMLLTLQVPEGSPGPISFFLSLVESISNLIRPLTLSFRLAANITAGHTILAMMSSSTTALFMSGALFMPMLVFCVGAGYYTFEIIIATIQSFVFTLLVFMYSNDYTPTYSNN